MVVSWVKNLVKGKMPKKKQKKKTDEFKLSLNEKGFYFVLVKIKSSPKYCKYSIYI